MESELAEEIELYRNGETYCSRKDGAKEDFKGRVREFIGEE